MKNRENFNDLPALVRRERKAHKLTQNELALLSKVGINLVSDFERGRLSIRLDKLLQILSSLGIELIARRGDEEVLVKK